MKTRRAQIEMVDWALVRRRLELVLLIIELVVVVVEVGLDVRDEFGEEEGEEKSLFLSTMADELLLSSGKKTRRRPIPQLWSLELLAFLAVKPIRLKLRFRFRFFYTVFLSKDLNA